MPKIKVPVVTDDVIHAVIDDSTGSFKSDNVETPSVMIYFGSQSGMMHASL